MSYNDKTAMAAVSKPGSDLEFIETLRAATEAYLGAVDRWEAAYRKYYRMPGTGSRARADLELEERDYTDRRRDLERLAPRARRLCLKHEMREPFSGLLRISLERFAPQHRVDSAISRSERNAAMKCLVDLMEACRDWPAPTPPAEAPPQASTNSRSHSFLRRLVDFFY